MLVDLGTAVSVRRGLRDPVRDNLESVTTGFLRDVWLVMLLGLRANLVDRRPSDLSTWAAQDASVQRDLGLSVNLWRDQALRLYACWPVGRRRLVSDSEASVFQALWGSIATSFGDGAGVVLISAARESL